MVVGPPPRHRVLRALGKAMGVNALAAAAEDTSDQDEAEAPIGAGQMKLYSYYKPGLQARKYKISVKQSTNIAGLDNGDRKPGGNSPPKPPPTDLNPLDMDSGSATQLEVNQEFEVVYPQFELPPEDFHSIYPEQGFADQPKIAPHIVFSNPNLPWTRFIDDSDTSADEDGNAIPWLALFPFDVNKKEDAASEIGEPPNSELRLTDAELAALRTHLDRPETDPVLQPTPFFSFPMTLGEFHSLHTLDNFIVPRVPDLGVWSRLKEKAPVEAIFVRGKLFKQLFYTKQDEDNQPKMDLRQFAPCAHLRKVNTLNATDAGVNDQGLFSVVHSRRSGPTDIEQGHPPRSQAVHLLSLEGLFINKNDLEPTGGGSQPTEHFSVNPDDNDLVGFVSLRRWSYLCQPPLSVNFIDSMRAVGIQIKLSLTRQATEDNQTADEDEMDEVGLIMKAGKLVTQDGTYSALLDAPPNSYLRCSKSVTAKLEKSVTLPPDLKEAMVSRLKSGYTMCKFNVASGEETAALFRGAFIPSLPVEPKDSWPWQSNNGQDLQILDNKLKLMDITYSSAWELGRTMATSDIQFVSALMRVRTKAYQEQLQKMNLVAANADINLVTKSTFLSRLPTTLENMKDLTNIGSISTVSFKDRWDRTPRQLKTPWDQDVGEAALATHMRREGSARANEEMPINDLLQATSDDFRIIHDWILDRMYLSGIPTHYLIPDPNYLPPESIRFFHIDSNWTDSFIDGAMSCANHTSLVEEDTIRDAIKRQFNLYLRTPIDPDNDINHAPQVPIFGLLFRSAVVSAFKDLIVEADIPTLATGEAPVIEQKRLGKDILLLLFSRRPEEIRKLKFSQPPHQQRFSVADELDNTDATFLFRKLFYSGEENGTDSVSDGPFLSQFENTFKVFREPAEPDSGIYNYETRCLDMRRTRKLFFDGVAGIEDGFELSKYYEARKQQLTSAFVGLQFNDTAKYFEIMMPWDLQPMEYASYQIRVRPEGSDLPKARGKLLSVLNPGAAVTARKAKLDGLGSKPSLSSKPPAITPRQNAPGILPPPTHMGPAVPLTKKPPPKRFGRKEKLMAKLEEKTSSSSLPLHFRSDSPSRRRSLSFISHISSRAAPTRPDKPAFSVVVFHREFRRPLRLPSERHARSWLSMTVDFAADLIFSVRAEKPSTPEEEEQWRKAYVAEVKITIPLGTREDRRDDDVPRNVARSPGWAPRRFGGYRVRMLSNQRWVGTLESLDGGKYQELRLIPRSQRKVEPLLNVKDLSFVLSGIETGWVSDRDGFDDNFDRLPLCYGELRAFYAEPDDPSNRAQGKSIEIEATRKKEAWDDLIAVEQDDITRGG
ncbi:uncharacterized protein MKZ38_009347 [Zalerion maritima]|uniref:Uncharacterized protein n=1 Tax=Zalerion maritima TaxID=339359 RepID=A0AAD5WV46_9PEZI|nr:uncharacterized protein MKZ38_009347 [Zalerion maritima]